MDPELEKKRHQDWWIYNFVALAAFLAVFAPLFGVIALVSYTTDETQMSGWFAIGCFTAAWASVIYLKSIGFYPRLSTIFFVLFGVIIVALAFDVAF